MPSPLLACHYMRIQLIDPQDAAAGRLIALSDAYMTALYPAVSNHLESVEKLRMPNVDFFGAYLDDDLVACGAVKLLGDEEQRYAEIKRVFVLEAHRGKGLARRLMQHLEAHLRDKHIATARLETGIRQPEALALYRRLGYVERAPFGAYAPDPLSVYLEKRLLP